MQKFKKWIAVIACLSLLVIVPNFATTFAQEDSTDPVDDSNFGILVADSAVRQDFEKDEEYYNYWNKYWMAGGEATGWKWTTKSDNIAIFKFELHEETTTFEPWFEGEDYAGTFKIYASKDGKNNWLPVAEMTTTYEKNKVYNSTTGLEAGSYEKATGGNKYDKVYEDNIATILKDNESKVVYLKVDDIVSKEPDEWGDRIQLRSFGITYQYGGEKEDPDIPPKPDKEAPVYKDPHDGDEKYKLQDEYRIAVEGNTYDDDIKTYYEKDFAKEPEGKVEDGTRILYDTEKMVFNIEVDPNAVFIKLDKWVTDSVMEEIDGEQEEVYTQMINISLYDKTKEEYSSIVDYGTDIPGGLSQEYFKWKHMDNTWGRDGNNEFIVTEAKINPETGKKMLTLRFMARFQGEATIGQGDYNGRMLYKSFVVQSVVPVSPVEPVDPGQKDYPVSIDASILDAKLDMDKKQLVLPKEGITIAQLNKALVISPDSQLTIRFFDESETEVFDEDTVIKKGMKMWVYFIDGSYDIFEVIIQKQDSTDDITTSTTLDTTDGEVPSTFVNYELVSIATTVLFAAVLALIVSKRKTKR